ncbi:MAG: DHH family phosphoesterase [Lachnoclostridium sp.]|nr:DHH family phosphoesterase [Lachnospira sp.]MCM1249121.1 DHH family phosphoesterase [Lachnoclostridium sp.]MCM1535133.1 DHH family phosphoesterase [Clostridium sp.]
MRLKDLLIYDSIVIQCHDNPDADAIASGFGVYNFFKSRGKDVRLIYGGMYLIKKSNLVLMVSELGIPIEYVETLEPPELLITVDCQYSEGNVTLFEAKTAAVIDHHQISGELPDLREVRSNLGSCSTLVWRLLKKEGYDINEDKMLATALYYGLLTDTNNFTEIAHPLDKDLRDIAEFDRGLISRFRNANLSLEELEIAGKALMNYHYVEEFRYAVVATDPCDPNILGMISDLMLEVDTVDACLVYSVQPFGVKLSVRSCIKEVMANELARFITKGIGSGGGHLEKAGGFIQRELLRRSYRKFCKEQEKEPVRELKEIASDFMKWRMTDYFNNVEIIYADSYVVDLSQMEKYRRKQIPVGYVRADSVRPVGTQICIRTMGGDLDVQIHDKLYIMIGIDGEVHPNDKEKFDRSYKRLEEPYVFEGEYEPVIRDVAKGKSISLIPYAQTCISNGESCIYVKKLEHRVKVFTEWDKDKYELGNPGDYLAVSMDDLQDVYVIEQGVFAKTYEKVETEEADEAAPEEAKTKKKVNGEEAPEETKTKKNANSEEAPKEAKSKKETKKKSESDRKSAKKDEKK